MPATKLTSNNCFQWYQSTTEKKPTGHYTYQNLLQFLLTFLFTSPWSGCITHTHTHTHTLKKRANSSQRLFLWKQSYKVWVLCIGKIANVLLLLLACNLLLRLLVPSFSRMVPVALWVAAEGHSLPRVACSPSLSENRCQMHVFLQNTCAHGPPETREGVLRTSFCKLPSLQGM